MRTLVAVMVALTLCPQQHQVRAGQPAGLADRAIAPVTRSRHRTSSSTAKKVDLGKDRAWWTTDQTMRPAAVLVTTFPRYDDTPDHRRRELVHAFALNMRLGVFGSALVFEEVAPDARHTFAAELEPAARRRRVDASVGGVRPRPSDADVASASLGGHRPPVSDKDDTDNGDASARGRRPPPVNADVARGGHPQTDDAGGGHPQTGSCNPPWPHTLHFRNVSSQPTYARLVEEAGTAFKGAVVVVTHADIYFDSTFECALHLHSAPTAMLALSRQPSAFCANASSGGTTVWGEHFVRNLCDDYHNSHDAFVFRAPAAVNTSRLAFYPNTFGAENVVIETFKLGGYSVHNPCHDVHAFHYHCRQGFAVARTYDDHMIISRQVGDESPWTPLVRQPPSRMDCMAGGDVASLLV